MSYITSKALDETGYVVLDDHDQAADPQEWLDLEYVDWKSSGDTRFAPLTSAFGEMECDGFWNHTPPRTDKDGVWVEANAAKAPVLRARAEEPGTNIGRCRVIELKADTYPTALYNLHQDDNNRLNPDGTGWIVRAFFNLSDDPDSYLILREDRFDPETEVRISLPAGRQVIVDTQRFWHAVWHQGSSPRYCLIASWESGPALDAYIEKYHGDPRFPSAPLDPAFVEESQADVRHRLAERAATVAAQGRAARAASQESAQSEN
ncbi:hypothetical protein DVJ78_16570 [Humibacter sp. BT305]|uniref:Uncharacterized protein n=1 Tax=Cnuibacter physcomitrellae TaxID=1619308 RepID=A0A1X9LJQ8_9MICO|nr:hypothetical protein [Cnuibacter physcomitrellae]ARJ04538.1 hypothetical protein B5808_04330 [Cnuibacter physcomitrellae]AXH36808.1 hypothetical protein DVJ78_16570 [Humibacter sp. BT305]MCS5498947.1 aspartyl/asparaginyl beta-hydroxylase domain-containing protein [Cnuibacter physcomitrellae]GGI41284.1 hypothetical protein GCM10010988_33320 [Cnuibacter physcomitrellae]